MYYDDVGTLARLLQISESHYDKAKGHSHHKSMDEYPYLHDDNDPTRRMASRF